MRDLVGQTAAWLSGRPEEHCRRAAEALRRDHPQQALEPAGPGPVGRHIEVLCEGPAESALMNVFREACHGLKWRLPPASDVERWIGGRCAGNQAIGPDGFFRADDLRFGAFLIAPETVYPLHAHAAEELYIVIGGSARWWIADETYKAFGPGEVVHVPSWTPHAIRTGAEPVLTLWVWMGDVDFGAYRFEPAGFGADGHPI